MIIVIPRELLLLLLLPLLDTPPLAREEGGALTASRMYNSDGNNTHQHFDHVFAGM